MLKTLTPLDKIRDTIEAQRESVREDLRAHVGDMDPYAFEHLIRDLLERMSFTDCEVTQQTRDGGIDIRANFSIGISEIKTIGQVKRHRANIGAEALQQFYGVMHTSQIRSGVHLGLFITTSRFTASAVQWVSESSLPIVLIDGEKLVGLMIQHGLLVREVALPAALELDTVQPADEQAVEAPRPEQAQPLAIPVEDAEANGAAHIERKRQFKWALDLDEATGEFTLTIRYLPDPNWVRQVKGVRVSRDADFRPARSKLHAEIRDLMEPLFPGLDRNLLSAKAWSGAHRIYPSKEYGN